MKRRFKALYTHQKTKKKKIWQDGYLALSLDEKRGILQSEDRKEISSLYLKKNEVVECGSDLESAQYLIQIEEELSQDIQSQESTVSSQVSHKAPLAPRPLVAVNKPKLASPKNECGSQPFKRKFSIPRRSQPTTNPDIAPAANDQKEKSTSSIWNEIKPLQPSTEENEDLLPAKYDIKNTAKEFRGTQDLLNLLDGNNDKIQDTFKLSVEPSALSSTYHKANSLKSAKMLIRLPNKDEEAVDCIQSFCEPAITQSSDLAFSPTSCSSAGENSKVHGDVLFCMEILLKSVASSFSCPTTTEESVPKKQITVTDRSYAHNPVVVLDCDLDDKHTIKDSQTGTLLGLPPDKKHKDLHSLTCGEKSIVSVPIQSPVMNNSYSNNPALVSVCDINDELTIRNSQTGKLLSICPDNKQDDPLSLICDGKPAVGVPIQSTAIENSYSNTPAVVSACHLYDEHTRKDSNTGKLLGLYPDKNHDDTLPLSFGGQSILCSPTISAQKGSSETLSGKQLQNCEVTLLKTHNLVKSLVNNVALNLDQCEPSKNDNMSGNFLDPTIPVQIKTNHSQDCCINHEDFDMNDKLSNKNSTISINKETNPNSISSNKMDSTNSASQSINEKVEVDIEMGIFSLGDLDADSEVFGLDFDMGEDEFMESNISVKNETTIKQSCQASYTSEGPKEVSPPNKGNKTTFKPSDCASNSESVTNAHNSGEINSSCFISSTATQDNTNQQFILPNNCDLVNLNVLNEDTFSLPAILQTTTVCQKGQKDTNFLKSQSDTSQAQIEANCMPSFSPLRSSQLSKLSTSPTAIDQNSHISTQEGCIQTDQTVPSVVDDFPDDDELLLFQTCHDLSENTDLCKTDQPGSNDDTISKSINVENRGSRLKSLKTYPTQKVPIPLPDLTPQDGSIGRLTQVNTGGSCIKNNDVFAKTEKENALTPTDHTVPSAFTDYSTEDNELQLLQACNELLTCNSQHIPSNVQPVYKQSCEKSKSILSNKFCLPESSESDIHAFPNTSLSTHKPNLSPVFKNSYCPTRVTKHSGNTETTVKGSISNASTHDTFLCNLNSNPDPYNESLCPKFLETSVNNAVIDESGFQTEKNQNHRQNSLFSCQSTIPPFLENSLSVKNSLQLENYPSGNNLDSTPIKPKLKASKYFSKACDNIHQTPAMPSSGQTGFRPSLSNLLPKLIPKVTPSVAGKKRKLSYEQVKIKLKGLEEKAIKSVALVGDVASLSANKTQTDSNFQNGGNFDNPSLQSLCQTTANQSFKMTSVYNNPNQSFNMSSSHNNEGDMPEGLLNCYSDLPENLESSFTNESETNLDFDTSYRIDAPHSDNGMKFLCENEVNYIDNPFQKEHMFRSSSADLQNEECRPFIFPFSDHSHDVIHDYSHFRDDSFTDTARQKVPDLTQHINQTRFSNICFDPPELTDAESSNKDLSKWGKFLADDKAIPRYEVKRRRWVEEMVKIQRSSLWGINSSPTCSVNDQQAGHNMKLTQTPIFKNPTYFETLNGSGSSAKDKQRTSLWTDFCDGSFSSQFTF